MGGKPTNHSKKSGKCKVVGCTFCHESLPLNKSRGKGKGRIKRLVSDIPSTHVLSDWRVKANGPNRKIVQQRPDMDWDDEDDAGVEPEGWALSISLLLETALKHIQESVEASRDTEKVVFTGEDTDDEAEVPDFESFKNEYEVFKHEIERGHSVAESIDSWSGIEHSDADESSFGNWEDDWSIVDEDEELAVPIAV